MSVVSLDDAHVELLDHGMESVAQALKALRIATGALVQIADYSLCTDERADRAMQALRDIKDVIADA